MAPGDYSLATLAPGGFHIAGDGMLALWIPAFAGGDHTVGALAAGRQLAAMLSGSELPVGIAVHTGVAYVV